MTEYRVHVRQPTWVYGYIDIEQDEDWDGRPVQDQFDARDLAYDLLVDGSQRVVWMDSDNGDLEVTDEIEVLNG